MGRPPEDLLLFYEEEYPRLVAALDLYLGDLGAAEDIAQEALIRTMDRWSRVRELDKPGAWTRRVALNLAASRTRRGRAFRRALVRLAGSWQTEARDPLAARDAEVRAAVLALPEHDRAAVVLHYFLGHPIAEISAITDRPVGTVKSDLHRARRRLRASLDLDHSFSEDLDVL